MNDASTILRKAHAEALMEDIRHNTIVVEYHATRGVAQWRLSAGEKDMILAALREYADAN